MENLQASPALPQRLRSSETEVVSKTASVGRH
jgi:hypothetical protein